VAIQNYRENFDAILDYHVANAPDNEGGGGDIFSIVLGLFILMNSCNSSY